MKEGERSRWIVNEGTFLMMNTFDLLIDHLFFECRYHPWTVRNALDFFVESYSYKDQCSISFTHDMGSHYVFTPKGQSSYEIPYLTDCFSYMTQEQLCNWSLAACLRTAASSFRRQVTIPGSARSSCVSTLSKRCYIWICHRSWTRPMRRTGAGGWKNKYWRKWLKPLKWG